MTISIPQKLPDWLASRQRILQRGGRKISIRLEEEFWEQLEYAAKEQGLKLTDLVVQILGQYPGTNRTSLLRTYCARWMRSRFARAQIAANNVDIQGILTSCPMPCIIVSRERKLIARNTAFGDKILASLVAPDRLDEAERMVQFTLSRPISTIVRDLTEEQKVYSESSVAFTRGSAIVQMIGRFCLLNKRAEDTSPLLCFLYPRQR